MRSDIFISSRKKLKRCEKEKGSWNFFSREAAASSRDEEEEKTSSNNFENFFAMEKLSDFCFNKNFFCRPCFKKGKKKFFFSSFVVDVIVVDVVVVDVVLLPTRFKIFFVRVQRTIFFSGKEKFLFRSQIWWSSSFSWKEVLFFTDRGFEAFRK